MTTSSYKPDLLSVVRKTINPDADYGRSICCPFHSERDPSLHIFENQSWYCFGCGKGGDVYDLLGYLRFGDSWNSKNKDMFREIRRETENHICRKVLIDNNPRDQETELSDETKETFLWAAKAFHETLLSTSDTASETARNYLYRRGISEKTIRELKIGYAGSSELHKKGLALEPEKRSGFIERMKSAGFIRNGKEYFINRIIFPNFTKSGTVLNLTGRALDSSSKRYLNIPNVRKNLYLLGLSDPENELYITESVTDAVSLQQLGLAAAAVNGTALSRQMQASLDPYKKIIIVPQNDGASMHAACKWCETIPRCRILLPEYIDGEEKDINDILRLEGEQQCGLKLRQAAEKLMDCSAYLKTVGNKFL